VRHSRHLTSNELHMVRVAAAVFLVAICYLVAAIANIPRPEAIAIAAVPGALLGLPVVLLNALLWTNGHEMRW
jgi:hypothetical protein